MKNDRSKLLPMLILIIAIACAVALFGPVPEVHAQDGNPPTPVPEIVGGGPSTAGEWPWQVALIGGNAVEPNFRDDQFCGGSLIHPRWVLTAAHCITNDATGAVDPASSVDIVAGIYNLTNPANGYQRKDIAEIIRHPSYNRFTFDNDIALLRLTSPVAIGGSGETATALVPLVPASIGALTGTNSWVTGWGLTYSVPERPDQLYEVRVPIISNTICNDAKHYSGDITANMLCAGYDAGGQDSCQGDSGGPLVVYNAGQWKLAGIVSWGGECAAPFSPGVYTRVSKYGNWVNEKIGLTTLGSPSGFIGSNYTPTFTWDAVNTMTYYYLYINGPSGTKVFDKWYTAAEAGCSSGTGTCSVTLTTPLGGGNHTWWVRTWNEAGYGPWSASKTFSTTMIPLPGAATLVEPTGSIDTNNPTYSWNEASDASWYYLWVKGPSGQKVFEGWYTPAQANCNGTTCSVENVTPDLGQGTHTWWIRTWNSTGYGPWSEGKTFTPPAPVLPGQAILDSPTGNVGTNNPTYSWDRVANATWYYLWVTGPSGKVHAQWYADANVCDATTCSVADATPNLAPASYSWWVRTWSGAGYGPWSDGENFSTPIPWPNQPTLVSPNASITDLTPTYTWNAVQADTGAPATWYHLWVNGPSGAIVKKWYSADEAGCTDGTGTCSATPTETLIPGNTYTWWVRGWNDAGNGPWSDGLSFSHTSVGGFNSQFNGSATGWSVLGGYWFFDDNLSMYSTGRAPGDGPYSYSIRYSNSTYTNFDYSARMYRAGCEWCDNFLYIRGTHSPLDSDGFWDSGYLFTYANDGTFAVWKVTGGSWALLQDYTYTSVIAKYGWNRLRVVASENNLYYYINGTLVWANEDNSLASGYVGIAMDSFEDFVSAGDQLWVDWAVLNSYAEDLPVITDTVSPEQQALNDAANADGSETTDGKRHKQ